MGKGDQRTKRGKIYRGSYGRPRPRKHCRAPVITRKTRSGTSKGKTSSGTLASATEPLHPVPDNPSSGQP